MKEDIIRSIVIVKVKEEIKEKIKYSNFIRMSEAMEIVEKITGGSFVLDDEYDDLMNILNGSTESLNSLTLQNGESYCIGTRTQDVKEFIRLIDIADRDDVWNEVVEVDGLYEKLYEVRNACN